MLNLTHLNSFVMLEQTGSFTLAAERLGIGQSTMTQHIQRLEKALGRQLVFRDTHHVRLTGEGEALLGHARSMLDLNGRVVGINIARAGRIETLALPLSAVEKALERLQAQVKLPASTNVSTEGKS